MPIDKTKPKTPRHGAFFMDAFLSGFDAIPLGYCIGLYCGRKYGLRKSQSEDGRQANLVAEDLGGSDYISLNLYRLSSGEIKLKPCEMPEQKVTDFVIGVRLLS